MTRLTAAGAGFLLAVLWMDLMFDVQARHLGGAADAEILRSIAAYYRRVTTDAFPMNRLVGAAMLATLVGVVCPFRRLRGWRWPDLAALLLAVGPIALAAWRVFPNAVRLGTAADPLPVQASLARGILHDHVVCFASIAALLALTVVGRRRG